MNIPVVPLPHLPAIIERVNANQARVKEFVDMDEKARSLILHAVKAQEFVAFNLDIVYLLSALSVLQEANRQLIVMARRAEAVTERADAPNLERLASALANPKETEEYKAMSEIPEAKA